MRGFIFYFNEYRNQSTGKYQTCFVFGNEDGITLTFGDEDGTNSGISGPACAPV